MEASVVSWQLSESCQVHSGRTCVKRNAFEPRKTKKVVEPVATTVPTASDGIPQSVVDLDACAAAAAAIWCDRTRFGECDFD
ncbi:unnamed protein product [Heligmosomoides polygyrus]|uniref:Uncharacterized protein n=1 Tax=Heligmosomoides polygyrus TaxID=6339 RepID=A0A183G1T9_HELPZ|nr:unnamed protein product [Heligmosomoides polygyrus]